MATDAVAPGSGRSNALTTIAPFVEFRTDDVLVRHLSLPGLTTVSLCFGVGMRDEPAQRVGLTHLVEHVVMSALENLEHEHNASVDLGTTSFTATGTPDEAEHFLRSVCEAVSNLDLAHLDRERRVVFAEAESVGTPAHAVGYAFRCGLTGAGTSWIVPDPGRVGEAELRAHVATYFCRENATLAVDGPLPERLALPLPSNGAQPVPRTPAPVQLLNESVWVAADCPVVILTLTLPTDPPTARLLMDLLEDRLISRLRFSAGLCYDVLWELTLVNDVHLAVATFDSREDQQATTARRAWHELSRVAAEGPSVDELERARRRMRRDLSSPFLMLDHLSHWQVATSRGDVYYEPLEHASVRDSASVKSLRTQLNAAVRTATLLVPEGVDPFIRGLWDPKGDLPIREHGWCPVKHELPQGPHYRPRWWHRLIFRAARQTLVVTDDLLAHRRPDGQVHVIRFDDVAAVIPSPDDPQDVGVLGVDRCFIPLERHVFGSRAARQVRVQLERRGLMPAR